MNAPQDFRSMTADTIGKDLLQALVLELKLLPKPWPELTHAKQDDIIDRLRTRVEHNVKMAVHLLASDGRTVVAGELDQITIKDGVKAVVKFGTGAANLHELYEVAGKSVLVVVANAADHTGGMGDIQGEADQRSIDLGHEYHDNDGGGMDGAVGDDKEDVDGEVLGLPSPYQARPNSEELDMAYKDGYLAASYGKAESDAPIVRHELVTQWIRGFRDWHDQAESVPTAKLGELPNEHGVYVCDPDELIEWGDEKNSVTIKLLELQGGKWLYATNIHIGSNNSTGPLCGRHGIANSRNEALLAVQGRLHQILVKGDNGGLKDKALKDFTKFCEWLGQQQ